MKVATGAAMIMGCSARTADNGKTYYNVDVYDAVDGGLYSCSAELEVYNKVLNIQKPSTVKSVTLEVMRPYNGQSRLRVLAWQ